MLFVSTAIASDWSTQPIEPKIPTGFSAYTLGRNHARIGLFDQDYGLWDNVDVGTTGAAWIIGLANVHGKVTAVQSKSFDIAFSAAWNGYSLEKLGIPGGRIDVIPLGFTASWVASPPFSLHFGGAWLLADARGEFGLDTLGEGLATAIGVDMSEELDSALGDAGALYAGANLTLSQAHLAADYRINRRDAVVVQVNSFLLLSGSISGGYATEDDSVQVGASAHITKPLTDQLQSVITASWQFSWPRWYLRIGVPVPTKTIPLLWVPQAVEFSYRI
jgi:hypothetical protein